MHEVLYRLQAVLQQRRGADPQSSYTARLYAAGLDGMLKKIGEEATELVMAGKDGVPERIVAETADLWFHTLLFLVSQDLAVDDVLAELERRFGRSGIDEKAARSST
ncbi:MAG: phosphoribosyl-ATP diphosphatase [Immundisolibacter sp.]|uniref:phosphoribosyl-ATP diphosphatase n=1 Tax=Immundisolibacter sp. TaxID=1934948 RepID=UPI003567EEF8